jgi:hypothetical protein
MQVAQSAETTNFGTSIKKNEELSVQVWVWDGYWMPAELVTIFPDSDRRGLVRFRNGVTAPVDLTNVITRNPKVRGADLPSHLLSVMMYADQFRVF